MRKTSSKRSDLSRNPAQKLSLCLTNPNPMVQPLHLLFKDNYLFKVKQNHRRKKKTETLKETIKLLSKEINLPCSFIAYLLISSHSKSHIIHNAPTQFLRMPQPFHQSWFLSDSSRTNRSQEENYKQTLPRYFSKQFPSPPDLG